MQSGATGEIFNVRVVLSEAKSRASKFRSFLGEMLQLKVGVWHSDSLFSVLFPCYCLERLFSEVTYDVSTGMLNPTHSLTHGLVWHLRGQEISDGSWHSAVGIIFVIWHYCIVQYCEAVLI